MSYHEFYSQIFTALGYPCDPYDGVYRWNDKNPPAAIIKAVESLPNNKADFVALDLSTVPMLATVLCGFQWDLRRKARADEYPPIGDQIDMMFHAGSLPKPLADAIQAVKDKYPKPQGV